ncbi:polysaccharide pyruvyl transferase family protein [uncultured Ilyobacter sp.]|uniref:polysaccharide pyruvyl transferase family protein n=1 Tax=uncultured Ilyobacter sp. TaxID=544433 RepID=UPI0029C7DCC8|nr:polysaccharide pyruvyl transferase family protein [uncultured Ilyobacter sp.]
MTMKIKTYIQLNFIYLKGIFYRNRFKEYKNKKKIVLTLTPRHKNMGDHAIAFASKKFIVENFKDYNFIELDTVDLYKYGIALKKFLTPNDIIMILGGGNMGDMYLQDEEQRRFIIKKFKNNNIISLPQTINFSDTERGRKELEKSKKIYNSHKKLLLTAREKKSFEIMKKNFSKSRVVEIPDMVLYLNERINQRRDGVLLCFRKDREGVLSREFKENIRILLMKKYEKVKVMDTVLKKNVNKNTRNVNLKRLLTEIRKSQFVITDRLHGMIFCVITGTPCLVLGTFNHKVTGVYKWIEELKYIKLITQEDLNEGLINICNEIMNSKITKYNFSKEFDKLTNYIQNLN